MSHETQLQRFQEEVIDIQLQIKDLEDQKRLLKQELNSRLGQLLRIKKTQKEVKLLSSFTD